MHGVTKATGRLEFLSYGVLICILTGCFSLEEEIQVKKLVKIWWFSSSALLFISERLGLGE